VARREEWLQQVKLAAMLDRWTESATTWWSAIDTVPRSATKGVMRKLRGCKSGTPDTFVLYLGTLVALEMKSRVGKVSPAQRLVREGLLRAGVRDWWVCRTARSTMWALAESGVRFREIVRADGTIVCWQQPELPAWEVPKRNPQERRPWAPKWEPETAAQIAELQEVSRLQSEATAAIFYRSIGAAGE
jgi:hypothetical protein